MVAFGDKNCGEKHQSLASEGGQLRGLPASKITRVERIGCRSGSVERCAGERVFLPSQPTEKIETKDPEGGSRSKERGGGVLGITGALVPRKKGHAKGFRNQKHTNQGKKTNNKLHKPPAPKKKNHQKKTKKTPKTQNQKKKKPPPKKSKKKKISPDTQAGPREE